MDYDGSTDLSDYMDLMYYVGYPGQYTLNCCEDLMLSDAPTDQAIHLNWTVNTTLPVTSTWQIAYDGPPGDQPSPITGIISPTRAYTLTGLANYTWCTAILNAMLDSMPFLTYIVKMKPTGIFVYLPLVLKEQ